MASPRRFTSLLSAALLMPLVTGFAQNPVGTILQHANNVEINAYNTGKVQFVRPWGITEGVGTVFTASRCNTCHSSPVDGGNSGRTNTFFGRLNTDNSFDQLVSEGGPVLQPFSIAPFVLPVGTCVLAGETLPKDANVREKRIAPAVFGLGLIDAIDDQTIINGAVDQGDGIHGTVNLVLDNTTHTMRPGRFGDKAFHSSLVEFVAEAFAHDFGISNPLQPTEDLPSGQPVPTGCDVDTAVPNNTNAGSSGKGVFNLSHFVRYTSPNPPGALVGNVLAGHDTFVSIGCSKCHNPSMTTPSAAFYVKDLSGNLFGPSPALSNVTVGLYSDLLLHDMGASLKSGFPAGLSFTGLATNQQWRTTPLWGLSLRHLYLHDGRASDLNTAIVDHSPDGTGEAGIVIGRYQALSPSAQADLLAFLTSL